ncbi:oligosaccharide flippase family protein [Enterobacter cloacae]|uniref:oligosaccharide flippase family protein n=1 Tax=Enterobacter cloacae TaxID=550 RepID=UPI0029BFF411|nr:oligosaccharide flippase family protein [Enterobacter cloacae]
MIKQNALSNLAARIWGILSLFLFVPFYIKYLGSSGFGYIAFYNTLLALFAFADLGFSAAITREFARLSDSNSESETKKTNLLHSYQIIYLGISLIVACCIIFSAPWIANKWLVPNNSFDVKNLVIFMGLCIAIQLPTNLYIGAMMGEEKQVLANSIQILWGLLRSLGVLPVLALISNDVNTFFIWQFISNIVYLISLYFLAWHFRKVKFRKFDNDLVRRTYKYAFGMAGMSLLATFATQIDKIIVSKEFSIDSVGHYSLASTLSLIPLILITTLAKAVFPRLTRLYERNQHDELKQFYYTLCKFAAVTLIPISLVLAFFSYSIVRLWTGSEVVAMEIKYVVIFLVFGQMLQSLTVLPFHLSLSHAYIKINLIFSSLMVAESPLIYYLFLKKYGYGISGVSLSILITILTVFIPYMYFLHRKLMASMFLSWMKMHLAVLGACGAVVFILLKVDMLDTVNIVQSILHAIVVWILLLMIAMWITGIRDKKAIQNILYCLR